MSKAAMIVAGVMSGTSADGINVAIVKIGSPLSLHRRGVPRHRLQLIGHSQRAYPSDVRAAVLSAMNASQASVADLARLNSVLGDLYADAVLAAQRRFATKVHLVGCHGQTLYHQGEPQRFVRKTVAATWQTGEAAVIAARVGVPVVSDFRPADMAAGGKGAPLVPYLDYLWFRDEHIGRIVQNIGGIANLTAIPAGAPANRVLAFDTGPGNMVIDAVTQQLLGVPFDRSGKIAGSGDVMDVVLRRVLAGRFFRTKPPKTAGREEFGRDFVRDFLHSCGAAPKQNIVATATAVTARSISDALRRFVVSNSRARHSFRELIVSGGGAKNATLMTMLAEQLAPLGVVLRYSDDFGLPSDAKEAVAFAVLAHETWHRRPSNVPSATGARRSAILGKISYA
jgi:anhydro-N-acetylmuramic acid kinase